MNFYIINKRTCTRVKLFGEDLRKLLIVNGWKQVSLRQAEWIFINSCSFLKSQENYFISLIKQVYGGKSQNQKIIVFGCLPKTNSEAIKRISSLLFSRNLKEIQNYFKLKKYKIEPEFVTDADLNFSRKIIYWFNKLFLKNVQIAHRLMKRDIFHIRISSGCMGKCSYCSERFTTVLSSRTTMEIITSFKKGLSLGFKHFALNSDDSSSFGKDKGENIYNLLGKLIKLPEDFDIAISEFNPKGLFDRRLITLLSSSKISYITIPIQSASSRILKLMRRPYQISRVIKKIEVIRKNNSKLKINTHIIVGFPGETLRDFEKTKELVKKGLFDRIKVFKYSDRPSTEASLMAGKISEEEKKKRAGVLNRLIIRDSIKKRSISNLILNAIKI
jgi:MiaB/RimO family radical SAM methylthiotransferase